MPPPGAVPWVEQDLEAAPGSDRPQRLSAAPSCWSSAGESAVLVEEGWSPFPVLPKLCLAHCHSLKQGQANSSRPLPRRPGLPPGCAVLVCRESWPRVSKARLLRVTGCPSVLWELASCPQGPVAPGSRAAACPQAQLQQPPCPSPLVTACSGAPARSPLACRTASTELLWLHSSRGVHAMVAGRDRELSFPVLWSPSSSGRPL